MKKKTDRAKRTKKNVRYGAAGAGEDNEGGLSNLYIAKLMQQVGCKNFAGVFSSNNISTEKIRDMGSGTSLIANLSAEGERGTHFVCIVSEADRVIYADSLALGPYVSEDIFKFLQSLDKKIFFNTNLIQYPLSLFCGYYSILFAMLYDDGIVSKPEVSFTDDLRENDKKCIEYIVHMINNNNKD
jgi:hypothetical protein